MIKISCTEEYLYKEYRWILVSLSIFQHLLPHLPAFSCSQMNSSFICCVLVHKSGVFVNFAKTGVDESDSQLTLAL